MTRFFHYVSATFPRWMGWVVGASVTSMVFFATLTFAPYYPTVQTAALASFIGGILISCVLLIRDASLAPDQEAFQEVFSREAATFLRRVNWLALGSAFLYIGTVPLIALIREHPAKAAVFGLAMGVVAVAVLLGSARASREDRAKVVFAVGERLATPENLFHVRVSDADIKRVTITQAARLMVGKPMVTRGLYRIRQQGQDGGVTFHLPNSIDSLPMVEWKLWALYAGYVAEKIVLGAPSTLQGPEVRGADGLILQAMSLRGDDPSVLAPRNDRERQFLAVRVKLERRRYLEAVESFFRAEKNLEVLKAIQNRLTAPGIPSHETVKSWMDHVTLTTNYPLLAARPKPVATVEKLAPAAKKPEAVRQRA